MSTLSDVLGRPLHLEDSNLDYLRLKTFIQDLDVQEPLLTAFRPLPILGDLGQVTIDAAILEELGSANATLSSALGRLHIQWQSDLEILYLKQLIAFADTTDPLLAQLDAWDALGYFVYMGLPQFPARATPTGLPEGTDLLNAALTGSVLDGTLTSAAWVTDANDLDAIDFDGATSLITIPNDSNMDDITGWIIRGTIATVGESGAGVLYCFNSQGADDHTWNFRSSTHMRAIFRLDGVGANSTIDTDLAQLDFLTNDALVTYDFNEGAGKRGRIHRGLSGSFDELTLQTDITGADAVELQVNDLILGNRADAALTLDGTINFWLALTAAGVAVADAEIYPTLMTLTGV